jgi:hypothetical protein
LHLTQLSNGGCQTISLTVETLGLWILTLNFLRIMKSLMELEATFFVLLPDKDVPAMILDIAAFKLILMLSNLA